MSYYDRYREALGLPMERRTDALIHGVSDLARSQAQVEFAILRNLDPVVDAELQQLLEQQIQHKQQQPASQWDLIKSEQTQRLAMLKLAFDLRLLVLVMVALFMGAAIGTVVTIAALNQNPTETKTTWPRSTNVDY